MQGKITQVLNMQPPEILAMIEEAAGTRMFEERKDKALRTMAKKDKKIEEISSILTEEITPKLDKLRHEKQAYLEYQKVEIELDRLRRLVVAYDFIKCEEALNNGNSMQEESQVRLEYLTRQLESLKEEVTRVTQQKAQVEETRKKEMSKNGEYKSLQVKVDELSKDLVKIKTQSDLRVASIKEEQAGKAKLAESQKASQRMLSDRIKHFEAQAAKFGEEKVLYEDKLKEVSQLEELLQSLTTGVASDEGREGGFMQQLQEARNEMNESATTIEQTKLRISLLKNESAEINSKLKTALSENTSILGEKKELEAQIDKLSQLLKSHAYNRDAKREMEDERSRLVRQLEVVDEKQRGLAARLSNFEFDYQDPVRGFDRSKVKGLVAQLIDIDDSNKFASVALEITAGGRIYNVIVDDDTTGALLLKNGRLKRRVTIIPLNKIAAHTLDSAVISFAKSLAPGK
ncbi:Structural maintenance of chromosomes protein 2, partial [Linderina macrospora]